jgi:hypothetical protein
MTLPVPGLEFLAHVVVLRPRHRDLRDEPPRHAWLTRVLTVAAACRRASAVVYDAYTVI